MIRPCTDLDFSRIAAVINDGAEAYRGVIPADRWSDPYMTPEHLQHEIRAGVLFFGFFSGTGTDADLLGVMGLQYVQDVTLIRHAYVLTAHQGQGIGGQLLTHLRPLARGPILIGTWADAT